MNSKLPIHNEYKRRLKSLTLSLADFIHYVDMKLDPSMLGNIHNRDLLELIEAKCKELATLLPDSGDAFDITPIRENFLEVLEQTDVDTNDIIVDDEVLLRRLSKQEWEEILCEYNKRT